MSERMNISGGGPLEAVAGYSRAVRIGNLVSVAGTTTLGADGVAHPGDCYEQTRETLAIMGRALSEAGASFDDVIRTRSFITDISLAEDFMRAHGEVFADIRPASTLVEVSALVHPDLVIEIEIDAVVG
jgi:enamine deaminase RidA (YjgF/YER057c/UK114 family)